MVVNSQSHGWSKFGPLGFREVLGAIFLMPNVLIIHKVNFLLILNFNKVSEKQRYFFD